MDIYEDKDNARRDEIASLGGQGGGQNVFTAFYDRFKEVIYLAYSYWIQFLTKLSSVV